MQKVHGTHDRFLAPLLPVRAALATAFGTLGHQLEKCGMGHVSVEWYTKALATATEMDMDERLLLVFRKALDGAKGHSPHIITPAKRSSLEVALRALAKQEQQQTISSTNEREGKIAFFTFFSDAHSQANPLIALIFPYLSISQPRQQSNEQQFVSFVCIVPVPVPVFPRARAAPWPPRQFCGPTLIATAVTKSE